MAISIALPETSTPVISLQALLIILVPFLISCGDDNTRNFGDPQSPTQQFINSLTLEGAFVDDGRFTFGVVYEIQKEGRITKLCANVPNDLTYLLNLWDLSDTTVVAAVNVAADSGVLSCMDITAVVVSAGSRMGVTIGTLDYYIYDDNGGLNSIYPATFGDVSILGFGAILDPVGIQFPSQFFDNQITGIVDLVFEPALD